MTARSNSLPPHGMLKGMRSMHALILLTSVIIGVSTSGSVAQQTRFPTNEDLRHTRAISQPRLSPDGQSVIVQVSDATADGGRTHLWLVDIKQNSSRQLTYSPESDKRGEHNGEWMPDGNA